MLPLILNVHLVAFKNNMPVLCMVGFSTARQHYVGTCIEPYFPIVRTVQGNPLRVMSSLISHLQCFIAVLLYDDRFIIK